ncbi:MAG: tRNA (adenosine(37)-N6)-threonylcarbamoyltransferase complex transferase subunit TsaD [Clostridia bacterium]|nr:tRNA (adenosine(37)-N6)-threonylcarbamoyltransferase complex transferase subunit TsaD [Clostridia bacterium]
MKILGFESSCDETSASVVERTDDGRFTILSNIVASQIETHRLFGGVVPEIASRAHIEAISKITYEALDVAGCKIKDIDLVAVTANPGLIGALLVGVNFAKALAISRGIPLVAVDHIKGHIAASYIDSGAQVPTPPFIAFAASGGHTAIYLVKSYTDFELIGTTRDDAIGESFDKIGRMIGIPYPAGRGFDELAREGFIEATGDPIEFYKRYKKSPSYKDATLALPSPALSDGSLDFSFSGLKTAAINLLHRFEQRDIPLPRASFAARYTYEAVEAVAKKLGAAIDVFGEHDLVVAGGVAANSHLRTRLSELARARGVKLYIPSPALCGDNAAMIAVAGYFEYERGALSDASLNASALDTITKDEHERKDDTKDGKH